VAAELAGKIPVGRVNCDGKKEVKVRVGFPEKKKKRENFGLVY
jgi:hypothetical protein